MDADNWAGLADDLMRGIAEELNETRKDQEQAEYNLDLIGIKKNNRYIRCSPRLVAEVATEILRGSEEYFKDIKSWSDLIFAYRIMNEGLPPFSLIHTNTTGVRNELRTHANALKRVVDNLTIEGKSSLSHKNPNSEWMKWRLCPFCWRIAPTIKRKYSKQGRCSLHSNIHSAATKKARRILNYSPGFPSNTWNANFTKTIFFSEMKKLQLETNGLFSFHPETYNNPQYLLMRKADNRFNPLKIQKENQNLDRAWATLYCTSRYANDHGANLNDLLSVIKVLDDSDNNDPFVFRHKLHTAFSRAPYLATNMLIRAESWLRTEIQIKNLKRPGWGGKRPGAGRKPKKS